MRPPIQTITVIRGRLSVQDMSWGLSPGHAFAGHVFSS